MAVPHESKQGAPDSRRAAMQTKALGVLVAIVAVAGVVALVLTLSSGNSDSSQAAGQPSGSQVGDQTSASASIAPSSSAPATTSAPSTAAPTTAAPTTAAPTVSPTTAVPATSKPAAPAATRSSGSATAATKVVKYTVKKGDNLTVIASWFNQRGYGLVYDWNKSVIGRNPNLIHPGQTIIVSLTGKTMNVTTKTK